MQQVSPHAFFVHGVLKHEMISDPERCGLIVDCAILFDGKAVCESFFEHRLFLVPIMEVAI